MSEVLLKLDFDPLGDPKFTLYNSKTNKIHTHNTKRALRNYLRQTFKIKDATLNDNLNTEELRTLLDESGDLIPNFFNESMYFALTPKSVIFSFSAILISKSLFLYIGEPSKSTIDALDAKELTNQFHIIHPHVVK